MAAFCTRWQQAIKIYTNNILQQLQLLQWNHLENEKESKSDYFVKKL